MAGDWLNGGLRFALYLDLMVLFGVPLFAASALRTLDRASRIGARYAAIASAAAGIGAVLSLCGLAALAQRLSGAAAFSDLDWHVFDTILRRTGAGHAWAVRMIVLGAALVAAIARRGPAAARLRVLGLGGAVALASLAWGGHGAMDDGARGWLHLGADVLHLLAAGAWVGALVAFVLLAFDRQDAGARSVETLGRTSTGFARIGTALVAALLVSGVVNHLLISGPTLQPLWTTLYGELLAAKLALFVAMLGLAAANRFVHGPRLEAALAAGDHAGAARTLRRSLAAEAGLAVIVLALVAWLGMLPPDP